MPETISPLLGFVFGVLLIGGGCSRSRLIARSVAIATLAGIAATLVTGEYKESWLYLFADVATGGVGVLGAVLAIRSRNHRRLSDLPNPTSSYSTRE